ILVGDFNTTGDHVDMYNFKKYLIDTAEVFEEHYQHTYDGIVFKSRIDYILTTQDFETLQYEVVDTDVSDHFPVIAELKR
ncbi:MAG: endonuclease/exonuclease/phosphatase family protein, partial [Thermotaleaceae bacterium]